MNRSENLSELQVKIGQVENESLESTQRTIRMLNDSHDVGVKTANDLVIQGEKLNNISGKLDDINQSLKTTQENINELKGSNFFSKFFSFRQKNPTQSKQKLTKSKSQNLPEPKNTRQEQKAEFQKITGSDREEELNRNLDEISTGLDKLKALGLSMKNELDRQDPVISGIYSRVEKTHEVIKKQNTQMKEIN